MPEPFDPNVIKGYTQTPPGVISQQPPARIPAPVPSEASQLPRGPDPMRGLWPGSGLMQFDLIPPVKCDEVAEEILSLVAYIEYCEAQNKAFFAARQKRLEQAKKALTESPAYVSLKAYVLDHPQRKGGKSLNLPSGKLRVSTRKDTLLVHDSEAAAKACPEACYVYEAPPTTKLSKTTLKSALLAGGGVLVADVGGEAKIVAEIIPEITTLSLTPADHLLGSFETDPPALLTREEEAETAKQLEGGKDGNDAAS